MAIKVRQAALSNQETSVISTCQSLLETIPNLQQAISSLDSQGNLKGKAVSSAREFSNAVVMPLMVTVQQFLEYLSDNISKFCSEYDLEKDYTDKELEDKIKEIQQAISSLEISLVSLNSMKAGLESNALQAANKSIAHTENLVQAKQRQLKEYEEKLERLREYNDKSTSFLSEISGLISNIKTGMKQVSGGYDLGTGTFVVPTQSDLSWTNGAKQYIKNKVPDVNEVLSQLNDQEKAELGKAIAGKSKEEQVNILAEFLRNKKVWQQYDEINSTKAGEFEMSVISGWIEESLPKISTALACASAKLPVASMESSAFYALSKGTSIVSKGAPIIGTVLDYGQMVRGGESEQDASNKAIAHAAIDVGTMELSAAIVGGLLVSAPVSLTVAGTLVLFTGLSMTANSVFDNLYDKIKKWIGNYHAR